MYITEVIQNTYKNWNAKDIIFLEAPTGSGKTTFVLEELVPYARQNGKEVLFITNRTLLKAQIKAKVAKEQGIPTDDTKLLESTEAFDAITIVSYQKIQEMVKKGHADKYYDTERYQYIVCDEIHYILEDSMFNPQVYYFMKFLKEVHRITKILISATMKETKEYLMKQNTLVSNIHRNKEPINDWCFRVMYKLTVGSAYIWQYHMPMQSRNLQIYYFEDFKQIVKEINKSNKKWIVFISNKEHTKQFCKDIKRKCEYIHAENKEETIINQIVNKECFDADVLITTKLLDNGVNFKDSDLTNIVIDTISETEFLQMLGRKRIMNDEKLTLYVPKKTKKYFTDYLSWSIKKKENALKIYDFYGDNNIIDIDEKTKEIQNENAEEYRKNQALKDFFEGSETSGILRQIAVLDNGKVKINDAVKYKIHILSGFVQHMADALIEDEWIFVKEQLKWLGMEDSFAIENDLAFRNDQKVLAEIKDYIEAIRNQLMNKEKQKEFAEQMTEYMRTLSSENLKQGRTAGKKRIQDFFDKYKLPYKIKSKGGKNKGEVTTWEIKETEG